MRTNSLMGTGSAQTQATASLTVYYDGACPVCSREIAMYRRQAGAESCAWVDASSCPESALGAGLTRADALARFNVRDAEGRLVGGMRGFGVLWRALPRFAWLGRLAALRPVAAVLDVAYVVFLRVRPSMQSVLHRAPAPSGDSVAAALTKARSCDTSVAFESQRKVAE